MLFLILVSYILLSIQYFTIYIALPYTLFLYIIIVGCMKIFEVLTTVLLLIGAAVGGVLGLLIPRVTTGLILGFLVGLFIDAVCLPPLRLLEYICYF